MQSAPPPPTDPNLAANQAAAQDSLVNNLETRSQGDMSNLMARYGTHLALAGAVSGSPLATPAPSFAGGFKADTTSTLAQNILGMFKGGMNVGANGQGGNR